MTVHVALHTGGAEGVPFRAEFARQLIAGKVAGPVTDIAFEVEDPDLWWPAGQGGQPLHDLTVAVADRTLTRRIGLRTMELVTEQDAAGLSFKLRVNGRDIFAKGANWIPADALSGRISADKTLSLIHI